jgi:hypothetical protein
MQFGRQIGQFHADVSAAGFRSALAAGLLDQDAPRGLGCRGEEVAAAVPALGLFDIDSS